VRLSFFLATFLGGIGIGVYLLAWIVVPSAPAEGATNTEDGKELTGLLVGIVLASVAMLVLLLLNEHTSIGFFFVVAPLLIALGAVVVRRGSRLGKSVLVVIGLVLTMTLGAANYQPGVGENVVRPDSTMHFGNQYSNLFGDMTVDLTALDRVNGYGHLWVNTSFGDLTVILPENVKVALHGTIAFAEVDAFGSRIAETSLVGTPTFKEGSDAPLLIHLHLHSAFGTVRIVR
jgi:hypothetical protein